VGVGLVVVVPAEEFEVGEVGGSAVGPVDDVVGFAESGRHGASCPLAVFVAGDERVPHCDADDAGGAADVEDLAGAVGDDAAELAVACEPFEGGAGQAAAVRGFGPHLRDERRVGAGELGEVGDDAEVVLAAAAGPAVVVMGEVLPADRGEGFGAEFGTGAGVVAVPQGCHFGFERGGDDLA
jgi:hypothetical protein